MSHWRRKRPGPFCRDIRATLARTPTRSVNLAMSDHLALVRARTGRHRDFPPTKPICSTCACAAHRGPCGVCMSITPYLDEFDADPETKRVLAVALEMTRVSLGLTDDLADGIIAKQIVEL